MTDVRAAQLEVLDAVSDALEVIGIEGSDRLRDEAVDEANRRLKEDGHPFEFYARCGQVCVKELK